MESWISDLGLRKSIVEARIAMRPQYSMAFALEARKPYFGRQLAAFQSPPVRYGLMMEVARYAFKGKRAVRVLEVGSWAGASTITFGTVIQECGLSGSEIVCVDPWEQYFVGEDRGLHYKTMTSAAVTGSIQQLFHHNVKVCGLEGMIHVKKAYSREVLPGFEAESFDLVYIDGSHKKDDVLHDLQQAKRLVKSGGIICGDDLELLKSQTDPNVHRAAVTRDVDFIVDPSAKVPYHPGVTEAIAATFEAVWQQEGFWCVQRSGECWNVPDLQLNHLEIPEHLQHAVEIPYGNFGGYQLYQLGSEFIAYPVDHPHWVQSRLVEGALDELVLLLDAIDSVNKHAPPRIIESRHGFNVVSWRGKGWLVDQSAGYVNFQDQDQLRRLAESGHLLEDESIVAAKIAADAKFVQKLVSRTEQEGVAANERALAGIRGIEMRLGELEEQLQAERQAAKQEIVRVTQEGATGNERTQAVIRALEAKQGELEEQLQAERQAANQEIERVRQEAATADERALAAIRVIEEKQAGFEQRVREQEAQLRALHANWAVRFARRVARLLREAK
jgi:predicted O-methyltransferase YrrM